MKVQQLIVFCSLLMVCVVTDAADTLIKVASPYSVDETADRYERLLFEKGLTMFIRIDHTKNAEKNDLTLKPTQVMLFGNPKIGTPLMQCAPTVAIDLPQKVLFWEDDEGQVWLAYNDPDYLKERHHITGCDEIIERISGALGSLAAGATATNE